MFVLKSSGIREGVIKAQYGSQSQDKESDIPQISPPFSWQDAPKGTKSYAITFLDYDNVEDEGVVWIHWLVADIGADVQSLVENASRENKLLIQGKNSWSLPYGPYAGTEPYLQCRYGGPAPARKHTYEIAIYALDKVLGMEAGFTYNTLRTGMQGHVLGKSTLQACYGK